MLGRQVKTLVNKNQDAGYRSVIWDATNDYGKPVSAGIYLYQIQAGEYMQTKKMVLLKQMKRFLPLLILTGLLFGQESTIVLKDGRTIKGTIVFETEHEYTVRVVTYIGGGNEFEKIRSKRQVKILKSDILTNELTNEHNIPDDIEGIYER